MKKNLVYSIFILFCCCGLNAQNQNDSAASYLENELAIRYSLDQSIRKEYNEVAIKLNQNPELKSQFDSIANRMKEIDYDNQVFWANALDSLGTWPTNMSQEANLSAFLIIQHAPKEYMQKYSTIIDNAFDKGYIIPSLYAIFKDRLLMYSRKYQIYGSQTLNDYVWPIEDVENVDSRRKTVNLPPMNEYLDIFKRQGTEIVWDKFLTPESLIDLIKSSQKE